MTIVVPPSSAHAAAPAALERLANFSNGGKGTASAPSDVPAWPSVILGVSCALSASGIVLLICAIAVVCLPQSALSQLLMLALEVFGVGGA